jgi:hypothetical protein
MYIPSKLTDTRSPGVIVKLPYPLGMMVYEPPIVAASANIPENPTLSLSSATPIKLVVALVGTI